MKALDDALRAAWVRALIAVAAAVAFAAKTLNLDGSIRYFLDADVYAIGGRRLLDGQPLYEGTFPTTIDVWLPFTYPPIAAALFAPLALIPLPVAFLVVTASTCLALAWVVRVVVGKLTPLSTASAWWAATALTTVLLFFGPVHTTIGFGQVNVLLMAMVLTDALVVPKKWRGLLTGAAIAIKLTPAVFGLWYLLRGDWRSIARIGAGAGGLTLLGHLITPADSARYWADTLSDTGRIGGPMYASNQSIDAELWRLGLHTEDGGGLLWLAFVVLALVATAAVMWKLLSDGHPLLALGANALFGLLASPVSWSHHWVWAPVLILGVALPALALSQPGERGAPVLAWIFVATGIICFAIEPQSIAPAEQARELDWTPIWHVLGNGYLWWAIAALPMLWFLSGRLPGVHAGLSSPSWTGWKARQAP